VLFSAYPTLTAALDLPALHLHEFRPAAHLALSGASPALIGDALADVSLLWPTLRAPQLSLLDKVRLLRLRYFATSLSFEDCFAERFDRLSTSAFLSQRGFGARAIRSFFAPFYGGIMLDRSLDTSASVLLYTFKMLAEGRTVVPAAGMGAIPAQLASALPEGAIRTGHGVARLLRDDDGVHGVMLDSGEEVRARSVVLACDPRTIASLAMTARVHVAVHDGVSALTCAAAGRKRALAEWLRERDSESRHHDQQCCARLCALRPIIDSRHHARRRRGPRRCGAGTPREGRSGRHGRQS
jgi:phytoene dehydrogenase-like protein